MKDIKEIENVFSLPLTLMEICELPGFTPLDNTSIEDFNACAKVFCAVYREKVASAVQNSFCQHMCFKYGSHAAKVNSNVSV
jgi:hypothetical protein